MILFHKHGSFFNNCSLTPWTRECESLRLWVHWFGCYSWYKKVSCWEIREQPLSSHDNCVDCHIWTLLVILPVLSCYFLLNSLALLIKQYMTVYNWLTTSCTDEMNHCVFVRHLASIVPSKLVINLLHNQSPDQYIGWR